MVGIRGRSKACRTCLRRKKGCGQQRPSCEQCMKAQIPCGGYAIELVGINNQSDSHAANDLTPLAHACVKDRAEQRAAKHLSLKLEKGSYDPKQLSQSANEAKLCGLFWEAFLPNGKALPVELTRNSLGGWISSVQDLHTSASVLRKATLALALMTVGRREKSTVLIHDAVRVYSESLREASIAFRASQQDRKGALHAAIRLFALYEMLYGDPADTTYHDRPASWWTHAKGEFAFVADQPPSYFATGHNHQLFVDGRYNLIILSMRNRKRSYLGTQAWMTEPWAVHKKTPRDLLLDIFLIVPGIMQDIDRSQILTAYQQKIFMYHIIERTLEIQHLLLDWEAKYAATPRFCTSEEEIPESIKANDIAVAHLMSIFWAIALMAVSVTDAMLEALEEPQTARHQLFDRESLCRNLVNVMPVCLHPQAGICRTMFIAFQLGWAGLQCRFFPGDRLAKERTWLAKNLDKPEGQAIKDFVRSTGCVGDEPFDPV